MKNKLNNLKKGCNTCFKDAKNMNDQLKNQEPKNITFEEAKKIFFPLKDKINSKN